MRWVFATRPHAFVQLADEQHSVEGVNAKKTRAAVERTANWLDACAAMNETDEKNAGTPGTPPVAMFASVQGGCDVEARRLSAKAAASRCLGFDASRNALGEPPASDETNAKKKKKTSRRDSVFGFSIGGLGTGEAPGAARAKLVAACVAELPREKPVHVAGVGAPLDLIAMIENGVDLMDNAFARVMTLAGRALRFPVDAKDLLVEEKGEDAKARTGASKKRRRDASDDDESLFSGSDAFSKNLWSLKYRTDTSPLLENCACHTCAHHTRAYVHHLLQCREMTASVLLDAHNQFHFLLFFAAAREAIANDAFAAFAAFHRNRAKEETEAGESCER